MDPKSSCSHSRTLLSVELLRCIGQLCNGSEIYQAVDEMKVVEALEVRIDRRFGPTALIWLRGAPCHYAFRAERQFPSDKPNKMPAVPLFINNANIFVQLERVGYTTSRVKIHLACRGHPSTLGGSLHAQSYIPIHTRLPQVLLLLHYHAS